MEMDGGVKWSHLASIDCAWLAPNDLEKWSEDDPREDQGTLMMAVDCFLPQKASDSNLGVSWRQKTLRERPFLEAAVRGCSWFPGNKEERNVKLVKKK